ncbi:DUF2339 domain-containing protein [Gordonia zhaorongruii]|uniref:DUF2339 domain-containing protein n=1 Tax=Gordonia zhaorongruii TaxID=2597659 RepID=UPI0014048B0D|nr:DUF2339 domain-containing protein [Gordonia zhaorongruii]
MTSGSADPHRQPFIHYQTTADPYLTEAPHPTGPTFSQRLAKAAESGLIGKVLAGVGVAITLAGIVMLLILAAQAGLLRPEIRTAGGGLLAAVLAGLGIHIGRNPAKRPGAAGLVATGIAGLLFDVLAMSTFYEWLPPVAALAAAGAIAGVGLGVAHVWNSQAMGLMVSIPVLLLAPFVTAGVTVTLVGFVLVYAATTLWIQVGRNWFALYAVNTAAVVIPAVIYGAMYSEPWIETVIAITALVVILGSSILLVNTSSCPSIVALISTAAALPMMFAVHDNGVIAAGNLALGAALFAAAAFGTYGRVDVDARIMWFIGTAAQLLIAAGYLTDDTYQPSTIITAGTLLAAASYFARDLQMPVRITATVFSALGILMLNGYGAVRQVFIADPSGHSDSASLLIGGLLGLIATALLTWSWATENREIALHLSVAGALIGLWLTTTTCLSAAHVIVSDAEAAFRAGHAAATVIWGICATAALLWARTLKGTDRTIVLGAGLSVMAAAIGKLFLFDLAALDGVFRVIAFIGVGLLLLALGVSYAQKLGSDESQPVVQP